jgi:hypothetical protein
MLAELLSEVESRILSFGDGQHDLYTATIGNSLRAGASQVESKYRAKFARELEIGEKYLVQRIEATDSFLLNREK